LLRILYRAFFGVDVPRRPLPKGEILRVAALLVPPGGAGSGARRLRRSESAHLGELRFRALLDNDGSQQVRFE
jgi:hypothetical protein